MLATVAGALSSTAIAALRPTPAPPQICSSDTFSIDGHVVTIRACVPANVTLGGDGRARVPLYETAASGGESVTHLSSIDFQNDGPALSRTIDDLSLEGLGIASSLHVTVGFRPGLVRLEHALLTPGARALK